MLSERIHDQTSLRQHSSLLLNFAFCECDLEIFAHLLQRFSLQLGYIPAQCCYLVYASIALEVRHKLNDRLQQVRALPILPRLTQASQLLIRRREHLQALQRCHRQRQVLLRAVKPLNIRRHLCDCPLGLQRSRTDALNPTEELRQLGLSILDALDGVIVGGGLGVDQRGDIVVELAFVAT